MSIRLACVAAGLSMLVLAGCNDAPPRAPESTQTVAATAGIPGGVITNKTVITARVTAKDTAKRQVTLLNADGQSQVVDVPKEAVNFDQVNKGDLLVVTHIEQIAVAVFDAAIPIAQGEAAAMARAEKGEKPGGAIAQVIQLRGKVTAIDTVQRTATVAIEGGPVRVLAVRDDIDLTKQKVGDQVAMRITETVELHIETKADQAK